MPGIDGAWVGGGTMNCWALRIGERGQMTSVQVTYDQGGQLPAGVRRRHGAGIAAWG